MRGRLAALGAVVAAVTLAVAGACGGDEGDRSGATPPPVRDAAASTTAPRPSPRDLCRRLTAAEVSEVLGATFTSTTVNGECEYNVAAAGRLVRFVASYFDRAGFVAFAGGNCRVEKRDDAGGVVATFCGEARDARNPGEVWFPLGAGAAELKAAGLGVTLDQFVALAKAAGD